MTIESLNLETLSTDEISRLNSALAARTTQAQMAMNTVANLCGKESDAYAALMAQWAEVDGQRHEVSIICGQRMMREQMEHISPEEWSSIVD